ncbi:hypothetical protein BVY01_04795 [bacterium I07]|nr:hypothetical protein BVY01_04795 [bacterium I07]
MSLIEEQNKTLKAPRLKYGMLSKMLFSGMDMFYGKKRTLSKFKVLEVIARMPYQAWENVAYVAITHTYANPPLARSMFDIVKESREMQDNEQWHLLILGELTEMRNIKEGVIRYKLLPQIMALVYYYISWILYVIKPSLSHELNLYFEDHAEHEYMLFVQENPDFEHEAYNGEFQSDYGSFQSIADLLRQIGLDERHHKEVSAFRMKAARFHQPINTE